MPRSDKRAESASSAPTEDEELPPYIAPEWTFHEDGSVTIHLPAGQAGCLAYELTEWEALAAELRQESQNWKRSPIARENRREAIVLGNCFRTIRAILGRSGMKQLVERLKEGTDNAPGA